MSSLYEKLDAPTRQRLASIKLFAMDVDGTLTNGQVTYVGSEESQSFDVIDGQGLVWLRKAGIKLAWITGRGCGATSRRADELKIDFTVLKCKDKYAALQAIQTELGISQEETLSMGDDLPDLALAKASGFFCAPGQARPELLSRADYVTEHVAGSGAVREVCELILRATGQWQAIENPSAR